MEEKEHLVDDHIDYPDGSVYDGFTLHGKRHGNGTLVYTNGDQYTGEWIEDEPHGQGTY